MFLVAWSVFYSHIEIVVYLNSIESGHAFDIHRNENHISRKQIKRDTFSKPMLTTSVSVHVNIYKYLNDTQLSLESTAKVRQ